MIDKEFLRSLRGLHPYEMIVTLSEYFQSQLPTDVNDRAKFALEIMATISHCAERLGLDLGKPDLSGNLSEFVNKSYGFIVSTADALRPHLYRTDITGKGRTYGKILFDEEGLSETDIEAIQGHLLRLRELLDCADELADEVKAKILRNVEDIERHLHGWGVDSRTLVGLVMSLWASTKEAKNLYDIVVCIAEIVRNGFEKQTGIPWDQIPQKLLE